MSQNRAQDAIGLRAVRLDETNVPPWARPAVQRLLEAPETDGLAAFEIGRESARKNNPGVGLRQPVHRLLEPKHPYKSTHLHEPT